MAEPGPGNAVELAHTPATSLGKAYPYTQLTAWGPAVGLPEGQMGNSEVGHLNLGAGAIVNQDITRIDKAIEDERSSRTRRCARPAREPSGGCTCSGWSPPAGSTPSLDHLRALIELAAAGRARRRVHAFTDGRDTPPQSGAGYLADVEERLAGVGRVASRRRPLLRDGPRQALGPDAGAYDAIVRAGRAGPRARAGGPGGVRPRRDRRVHRADARGRGGPHPRRRRGHLLQLPGRPRPADDRSELDERRPTPR